MSPHTSVPAASMPDGEVSRQSSVARPGTPWLSLQSVSKPLPPTAPPRYLPTWLSNAPSCRTSSSMSRTPSLGWWLQRCSSIFSGPRSCRGTPPMTPTSQTYWPTDATQTQGPISSTGTRRGGDNFSWTRISSGSRRTVPSSTARSRSGGKRDS